MDDPSAVERRGPMRRALWIGAGSISIALAGAGVVLPVLPTTPFVLLAAACYLRGSRRLHGWLLRSKLFGPMIERWQRDRSVSLRAKVSSIVLIVLTIGSTIAFAVESTALRLLLTAIGCGVIAFLLRLKTATDCVVTAPGGRAAVDGRVSS